MGRIIRWVAAAVIVTGLCATIYAVMQQAERQGVDDGPIRLASQVASLLRAGEAVTVAADDRVMLDDSEAAFFVVYGAADTPLAGTGILAGNLAVVPRGVIDAARKSNQGTVTWEPRPGLRFAIDSVSVGGRVVVAGESLAPAESRIDRLGTLILAAWAATLVVLAIAFVAVRGVSRTGSPSRSDRHNR